MCLPWDGVTTWGAQRSSASSCHPGDEGAKPHCKSHGVPGPRGLPGLGLEGRQRRKMG